MAKKKEQMLKDAIDKALKPIELPPAPTREPLPAPEPYVPVVQPAQRFRTDIEVVRAEYIPPADGETMVVYTEAKNVAVEE